MNDYTNEKFDTLTAEAWGAWLLAAAHCDEYKRDSLPANMFLEVGKLTSMETYSMLEEAGLVSKTPEGETRLHTVEEALGDDELNDE